MRVSQHSSSTSRFNRLAKELPFASPTSDTPFLECKLKILEEQHASCFGKIPSFVELGEMPTKPLKDLARLTGWECKAVKEESAGWFPSKRTRYRGVCSSRSSNNNAVYTTDQIEMLANFVLKLSKLERCFWIYIFDIYLTPFPWRLVCWQQLQLCRSGAGTTFFLTNFFTGLYFSTSHVEIRVIWWDRLKVWMMLIVCC